MIYVTNFCPQTMLYGICSLYTPHKKNSLGVISGQPGLLGGQRIDPCRPIHRCPSFSFKAIYPVKCGGAPSCWKFSCCMFLSSTSWGKQQLINKLRCTVPLISFSEKKKILLQDFSSLYTKDLLCTAVLSKQNIIWVFRPSYSWMESVKIHDLNHWRNRINEGFTTVTEDILTWRWERT